MKAHEIRYNIIENNIKTQIKWHQSEMEKLERDLREIRNKEQKK